MARPEWCSLKPGGANTSKISSMLCPALSWARIILACRETLRYPETINIDSPSDMAAFFIRRQCFAATGVSRYSRPSLPTSATSRNSASSKATRPRSLIVLEDNPNSAIYGLAATVIVMSNALKRGSRYSGPSPEGVPSSAVYVADLLTATSFTSSERQCALHVPRPCTSICRLFKKAYLTNSNTALPPELSRLIANICHWLQLAGSSITPPTEKMTVFEVLDARRSVTKPWISPATATEVRKRLIKAGENFIFLTR